MADTVVATWTPLANAPTRAHRRGGPYQAYHPDLLVDRPLALDRQVAEVAAHAEIAVRRLRDAPGAQGSEGLARFLLRSEAIASSRIEGMEASPAQVGLAELAADEDLTATKVSRTARRVAANITAVRTATADLARADRITVADVEGMHAVLLADEPQLHGLRTAQNWIGGSDYHPIDAEFVPPPPDLVPGLMADLVAYLNSAGHAGLIQAGIAHAQFETIHPFNDGNGRIGRALIHTVLVRRGLTPHAVVPVSPVLLTRSQEYVRGLTAYRYLGPPDGEAAKAAVSAWLRCFLDAVSLAVTQAEVFAADLAELHARWEQDLAKARAHSGVRTVPRADSAIARILACLQEHPVLTASSVVRLFDVSRPAAAAALEELTAAGILTRRRIGRGYGYLATDVYDLLTFAERRLASTRWDTTASEPARPVPYRPAT
jgi:Fic family protein